jgi:hypothetical protein
MFYLNKDIMMIKNCTKFVLIVSIGLSLFSGLSHTAFAREDDTAILLITNPSAPARLGLGAFSLIHDTEGFSVFEKNGKKSRVQNRLVDKSLRGIPQSGLEGFLKNNGHLSVNRGSDGEYSLRVSGGLDGGFWGENLLPNALLPNAMIQENVELATKKLQKIVGPAVATVSEAVLANAKATTKLATALEVSNQLAADALKAKKNEKKIQQLNLDLYACIDKHPREEGTVGIPSACAGYFNALNKATGL